MINEKEIIQFLDSTTEGQKGTGNTLKMVTLKWGNKKITKAQVGVGDNIGVSDL